MSMLKVIVTILAVVAATPVAAQTAPDGWYDAGDVASPSPKPSCGKMPRDGEYKPLFKLTGGVYTACQWSYQGPKKRVVWGSTSCLLQTGMTYQDCLRFGPTASAPYQVPGSPYWSTPPGSGYRYQCNRDGSGCGYLPRY